tara:strand:+ start:1507 stop:2226 length:720 start_codon:yes stop_codon:yes gene_type:complete
MKRILITGATGGIGSELVKLYNSHNYFVLAFGTNAEKLNLLKDKYKDNIEVFSCDMKNKEEIQSTFEKNESELSNIDILVNNAGITRDNLFIRLSDSDWDDVMDINFFAHTLICKLVLRGMMKKRWGRIVSISSDAAKIGNPGQANYVSSKGALEAFTKTIANEVAKRGITVNCVAPGFIKTEIIDTIEPATLENMVKMIPTGQIGSAANVANAVFFLTSEESSYITGQILHVNGGLTM